MPTYTLVPLALAARTHAPVVADTGPLVRTSLPIDRPLANPTKSISGHVYDTAGAAVVGATVVLFRQSDNFPCKVTTSGPGGVYAFPRRSDDAAVYFTIAYSIASGATQVHGTSDRGLVPA